jgi:hypothetical protein
MPDYDAGFKIVARSAGPRVCRLIRLTCQEWEPIGDTLQATERLADRAFRARHGQQRFVVYLEAYTRWQAVAPCGLLAKSALLSERERLPTLTLVFILLPRGYREQGGRFRLEVAGRPTQQLWYREVRLWEQVPQRWWQETPGLMPLYPLCRHHRPRREAVTFAARTIAEREGDPVVRADLLTTLCIFGKLAYPELDAVGLIGREQMRESKFYQEILEEGRVEGRTEGELRRAQADVREVIEERFGAEAAAEFGEALGAIRDPDTLSRLHRQAIRCRRLADLRRALANGGARG